MRARWTAAIAVIFGLAGFALHLRAMRVAFEAERNLPLRGNMTLAALWLFTFAVLILAALLSFLPKSTSRRSEGLYRTLSVPARVFGCLAGVLTAVGGAWQLAEDLSESGARLNALAAANLIVFALLLLSGVALLFLILTGRDRALAALLPGFAACFWLVLYYHDHSQDAVLAHYAWTLLFLMAAVLAFYFQAGCSYGRPRPRLALFFSLTAGIYACTALPACESLGQALLLAGIGIWMLLHTNLLARAPSKRESVGRRLSV